MTDEHIDQIFEKMTLKYGAKVAAAAAEVTNTFARHIGSVAPLYDLKAFPLLSCCAETMMAVAEMAKQEEAERN